MPPYIGMCMGMGMCMCMAMDIDWGGIASKWAGTLLVIIGTCGLPRDASRAVVSGWPPLGRFLAVVFFFLAVFFLVVFFLVALRIENV